MRTILRENSLSVVMFGLFGLCLLGHSLVLCHVETIG
jgi:hypothetical protein